MKVISMLTLSSEEPDQDDAASINPFHLQTVGLLLWVSPTAALLWAVLCFWPTLDVRWNLFLTFPPPPCSFPQSNLTQNMIYNDLSTFYSSHTHHQLLHPSEDPDWIPASALPQPQDVFYWVSCLQMVVYSCLGIWAKENWIAPHKVTPAASWLQMQTAVSGEQKMAAAHWFTKPSGSAYAVNIHCLFEGLFFYEGAWNCLSHIWIPCKIYLNYLRSFEKRWRVFWRTKRLILLTWIINDYDLKCSCWNNWNQDAAQGGGRGGCLFSQISCVFSPGSVGVYEHRDRGLTTREACRDGELVFLQPSAAWIHNATDRRKRLVRALHELVTQTCHRLSSGLWWWSVSRWAAPGRATEVVSVVCATTTWTLQSADKGSGQSLDASGSVTTAAFDLTHSRVSRRGTLGLKKE